MLVVRRIEFNWHHSKRRGEVYSHHELGRDDVVKIEKHWPQFAGDLLFYSVVFENGNEIQIFNPNRVFWDALIFDESKDEGGDDAKVD